MAKPLPVELLNYINRGLADKPKFFFKLSKYNKYVAPETTNKFYEGLVAFIKDEVRLNGAIRLPEIGDFVLVKEKPHLNLVRNGKIKFEDLQGSMVLKFLPKESFRDYFKGKTPLPPPNLEGMPDEYRVEE